MNLKRILPILLLFFLISCGSNETKDEINTKQVFPVESALVVQQSLNEKIELSGHVLPSSQVPLFTASPLFVEKIHKETGDQVNKGDVIVTLNKELAEQQLKQAKEIVSQLDHTLLELKRLETFVEHNITSLKQLNDDFKKALQKTKQIITELNEEERNSPTGKLVESCMELLVLQAEITQMNSISHQQQAFNTSEIEMKLSQAKDSVKQAQKLVEATNIKSPIDGIIAQINVTEHGMALPTTPVAVVVEDTTMTATFNINSYQVGKLSPDMKAAIYIDGYHDKIESCVATISPTIDPTTNSFKVEVPFQNNDHIVKGGMRVTSDIILREIEKANVIPIEALLYDENKPYVFVAKNNKAIRKNLTLGVRNDEVIEVLTGLHEGDEVITRGKERLVEGVEITLRNE